MRTVSIVTLPNGTLEVFDTHEEACKFMRWHADHTSSDTSNYDINRRRVLPSMTDSAHYQVPADADAPGGSSDEFESESDTPTITFIVLYTEGGMGIETVNQDMSSNIFRQRVGGYLEVIPCLRRDLTLYCDEYGMDLPVNTHASSLIWSLNGGGNHDMRSVHGNIIICGGGPSDKESLTDDQIIEIRNIVESK
jgi:Domain of unknown function (DUF3846)